MLIWILNPKYVRLKDDTMVGKWLVFLTAVIVAVTGLLAGLGLIHGGGDNPGEEEFTASDASQIAASFSADYSGYFGEDYYLDDNWSKADAKDYYPNGSTMQYVPESNYVDFHVLKDKSAAKIKFLADKTYYSTLIKTTAPGLTVFSTGVKDGLDGAMGYYANFNMGSKSGYLYYIGYLGNAYFESFSYLSGKTIDESDIAEFAHSVYKAITNPKDVGEAKIYNSGEGDDDVIASPDGSVLIVYGNANNDYTIDEKDVRLIEKIIKEGVAWQEDYPFADANCDSKVDKADVEQTKRIIAAGPDNQIKVFHKQWTGTGYGVADTTYPILSAMSSSNQTDVISYDILGIDDEIKAMSYKYPVHEYYDKYLFGNFFDVMDDAHCVANSGTAVNLEKASTFMTQYGCTAYIYSNSSSILNNTETLEQMGLDTVKVADSVSDIGEYTSSLLLLGWLFDNGKNGTHERAIKATEWFNSYNDDVQKKLSKVWSGEVEQVRGVASSIDGAVNVSGSANTELLLKAGMDCPLATAEGSGTGSSSLKYTSGIDTWLDYIKLDTVIILRGSFTTTGSFIDPNAPGVYTSWSWFDKDYDNLPKAFAEQTNGFHTLECYKKGQCLITSTMLPAPLKSAIMANYFYAGTVFDDATTWSTDYCADFFKTFFGWSDEFLEGQRYVLTQEEVCGKPA